MRQGSARKPMVIKIKDNFSKHISLFHLIFLSFLLSQHSKDHLIIMYLLSTYNEWTRNCMSNLADIVLFNPDSNPVCLTILHIKILRCRKKASSTSNVCPSHNSIPRLSDSKAHGLFIIPIEEKQEGSVSLTPARGSF